MLPDCPPTIWNSGFDDVVGERDGGGELLECPLEISATDYFGPSEGPNKDAASITAKKDEIMAKLQEHGCVWFKDMELTKSPEGFRSFYDALGLDLCLDPIHTSGLRKMISKKDGIYEEVNKPTLRGHYIGLHQESTHVKTSTYGAFVCFQGATIEGGDFLVADGARILRDLDPAVLQRIYENKVDKGCKGSRQHYHHSLNSLTNERNVASARTTGTHTPNETRSASRSQTWILTSLRRPARSSNRS
mmetsp:Transcript_34218/g.90181  ORF Transcript_34218/g.90181 Transcript_34218/m.90181 type:complete len:247 (-) Transcript_34218:881-1621(-)